MVIKPKRILWPTDFSPLSLHAGKYAGAFREAFGAELHVVHVVPPLMTPDVTIAIPVEMPIALTEPELLKSSRTGLEALIREQFGEEPSIHFDALYGSPWVTICDYATSNEIDLIVVATHGRTGLKRVLIGSTAEQIVRHAPCPVLTVKVVEKEFLTDSPDSPDERRR